MKINQYLQLSISSVTDVMSRDGVASKRVETCSSRLKLTLMNTLFYKKHHTIHFRKTRFLAEIWVLDEKS